MPDSDQFPGFCLSPELLTRSEERSKLLVELIADLEYKILQSAPLKGNSSLFFADLKAAVQMSKIFCKYFFFAMLAK